MNSNPMSDTVEVDFPRQYSSAWMNSMLTTYDLPQRYLGFLQGLQLVPLGEMER
jgi:hypothetical protein